MNKQEIIDYLFCKRCIAELALCNCNEPFGVERRGCLGLTKCLQEYLFYNNHAHSPTRICLHTLKIAITRLFSITWCCHKAILGSKLRNMKEVDDARFGYIHNLNRVYAHPKRETRDVYRFFR